MQILEVSMSKDKFEKQFGQERWKLLNIESNSHTKRLIYVVNNDTIMLSYQIALVRKHTLLFASDYCTACRLM